MEPGCALTTSVHYDSEQKSYANQSLGVAMQREVGSLATVCSALSITTK